MFSCVGSYFHQQNVLAVFVFDYFVFIESCLCFIIWYFDLQTYFKFLYFILKKIRVCTCGIYVFRCIGLLLACELCRVCYIFDQLYFTVSDFI
jgi:hypothetical protein